ncbi:response regulator [Microlunatus parietis]|uniref:DNA-binding NarL/FixJ family response regulator n=1 Tax=Microlunatus parietis TaxID=682979 RepID=A0A7Y9I6Y8_9ACTN|nr:response regulator transcription factor [Microlunatus parietis]NYE70909.1 DNA-binding NarL/FixJ family response regulator [Microlunatus parietis]
MITVAVVDDQAMVRTGLISLLDRDPDISIVGEASNGKDGIALLRRTRPDVALMDIRMPVLDGIEATTMITADPELNGTQVVILTTFDEDEHVLGAIRAGAAGFLLKDVEPDELRRSVHLVATGSALLAPSVTGKVLAEIARARSPKARPELVADLTDREREVLAEVGRGRSNDEVGAVLFISPATARTYVSRLLSKLGVRDRAQLVVVAYESGLVTAGER